MWVGKIICLDKVDLGDSCGSRGVMNNGRGR